MESKQDRLKKIHASAKGTLADLAKNACWTGNRLRVTGMQNGLPKSESIGSWRIELHPHPIENVVELRGFYFAKGKIVIKLDLDEDNLTIGGEKFVSRTISGKSPLFGNTPFHGVAFENKKGRITGSVNQRRGLSLQQTQHLSPKVGTAPKVGYRIRLLDRC